MRSVTADATLITEEEFKAELNATDQPSCRDACEGISENAE